MWHLYYVMSINIHIVVPLPFLTKQCDQNEKNGKISKKNSQNCWKSPKFQNICGLQITFFTEIHFKVKIKFGLNWSWTTFNREKMFLVYVTNLLEAINVKRCP